MKKWPANYKVLLGLTAVFLLAAGLAHFYVLRPRRRQALAVESAMEQKISHISSRNWPVHPSRLGRLRREHQERRRLLRSNLEQVQKRAIATFAEPIQSKYGVEAVEEPSQFINFVSRLDYQEHYSILINKWRERNVILHPRIMNLNEDSVTPHIYRLLLQLWTVDTVLETVAGSGLQPVVRPLPSPPQDDGGGIEPETSPGFGAQVALQPVRRYRVDETSREDYLLEFPVRITIQGTTEQLVSLLNQLGESEFWLSINAIEIRKQPMRRFNRYDHRLEAVLEFSAFYPLSRDETIRLPAPRVIAPPGV